MIDDDYCRGVIMIASSVERCVRYDGCPASFDTSMQMNCKASGGKGGKCRN